MLFHASFPARDPRRAAEAVARLWGGEAFPFPVFEGSYIVIEGDEFGSAIEFCPAGQVLVPGAGEAEAELQRPAGPSETHLAISTRLSEEAVHALATENGWQVRTCWRGGNVFRVIEMWIDNTFLIEVLTEEMQTEYKASMTPKRYAALLERMSRAA